MWNLISIKNDNKGKINYSIVLILSNIFILISLMNLENRMIVYVKDCMENAAITTAFSLSLYDEEKIIISEDNLTINNIIIKADDIYEKAQKLISKNLSIQGLGIGVIKDIRIESIIVYNDYGNYIEVNDIDKNKHNIETSYTPPLSPNDIIVEDTSIYINYSCEYNGLIIKDKKINMERCISLQIRN